MNRSYTYNWLLITTVLLAPLSEAVADNLAFVTATSQLEVKKNQGKYHPIHLLDDDPATIWCEAATRVTARAKVSPSPSSDPKPSTAW
ncbi:MAG: hypothetical protein R3C68_01230 [Myxococcota bacterium]